jgi:hypothetical protein
MACETCDMRLDIAEQRERLYDLEDQLDSLQSEYNLAKTVLNRMVAELAQHERTTHEQ